MASLPPLSLVRQHDTHRLIPSRHLPRGDSVLVQIADDDAHLQALFALDAATNDRLLAEQQLLPGIGIEELVFAVPFASVINASFCHAHPLGSRFNGPDRGAWYAAFDIETSQAEVAFHKAIQLSEIGRFHDRVTYDDYLADFSCTLYDLRRPRAAVERKRFDEYLDPDSYVKSQRLAERLMAHDALGLVYPSVRHKGGTCVACFRPALVGNVRRAKTYQFIWDGAPSPTISVAR